MIRSFLPIALFALLATPPALAETTKAPAEEAGASAQPVVAKGPASSDAKTDTKAEPKESNAASPDKAPSYLRQSKAPTAPPAQLPTKQETPLGRVIIALALVAVLGGIAVWAKRRRSGSPMLKEKVRLHTIGSVQLGAKSQVALLSVGREAILVGVSEQGVSCLRTYKEEELGQLTVGALGPLATPAPPEDPEVAFNDLLVRASKVAPPKQAPSPAQPRPASSALAIDQFTPTGFVDESRTANSPEDELPPHLKELLAETERAESRIPNNVKPLRPHQGQGQFGEDEGQAAELMRRFAELSR